MNVLRNRVSPYWRTGYANNLDPCMKRLLVVDFNGFPARRAMSVYRQAVARVDAPDTPVRQGRAVFR